MKILSLIKKPKIIVIIILIIIAGGSYKAFFSSKEPPYNFTVVEYGSVVQEVSAIGQVKKGEEINLGSRDSGRIEKIYVEVGEEIESGQQLVKLETTQLSIQHSEAQASLDLAQAELDKLLAGASAEEIQIAQTVVDNAQTSLADASQNLENIKAQAEEDLDSAYEDALNTLDDTYLKIYNALNKVNSIKSSYFIGTDQESIKVRDNKDQIEKAEDQAKTYLDLAKADPTNDNIDLALSQIEDALDDVYGALEIIREVCGTGGYKNTVPDSERTALDNHKEYINDALTDVINTEQTISSTKLSNDASVNTAEAEVSSAEGVLRTAQDELALTVADPRQEDINLNQAKLKQARAQVSLLEDQIREATLRSPVGGQVTKIDKEIGEQVSVAEAVISLLPQEPFQVKADISESDIGRVDLTNPVRITLDAFPEVEFTGKVIEIEPAETIISGVVYYRIKVSLEAEDNKIKPGMTANITIISATKDNVLVIPSRAVKMKEGRKIVRRLVDGDEFEEVEVETGLKGSTGEIEIISGLKEGDKVITFIND